MPAPPLHLAATADDVGAIQRALDEGAALDGRDDDGQTALYLAVRLGRAAAAAALLDAGADPLAHDPYALTTWSGRPFEAGPRRTLLHDAARRDQATVVKLLLARGASIGALDQDGLTPLAAACQAGSLECGRLLLDGGAAPGGVDGEGVVPLARSSGVAWVRLLLDAGASPQARPFDVLTPLGQAVTTRIERSVELLLDAGAEIDRPHRDQSPLAIAAEQGSIAIARLLVERGALVDHPSGHDGRGAIVLAARADRSDVVALLLEAGARRDLGLALREAALAGHAKVVGQLARGGAPVDERDDAQRTALHLAALGDRVECMRLLLEAGADVNASDANGRTAYALAHDLGALALLRTHGAQYERKGPRARPSDDKARAKARPATGPAGPGPGARVRHASFGGGSVVSASGKGDKCKLEIRFTDGTTRHLLARFVTILGEDEPAAAADTPEARAEDLLAAVLADPADDGVRLVYADHLTERGDPRGELIVVQCQLATLPASDGRRAELVAREADLIARHGERWLGPFGKLPLTSHGFVRGFLQHAAMTGQAFVDHGAALLDVEPITRLDVGFPNGQLVPRFAASPPLARLDDLRVTSSRLEARDIAALSASPHLRDLGGLAFVLTPIDTAAAMALAAWPHRRLKRLLLRGCQLSNDAADVLSESPHLAGLEALIVVNEVVIAGLGALVAALPRLALVGVDAPLAPLIADAAVRAGFRPLPYDDLAALGLPPPVLALVHSIDPGGTRGRRLTLWART